MPLEDTVRAFYDHNFFFTQPKQPQNPKSWLSQLQRSDDCLQRFHHRCRYTSQTELNQKSIQQTLQDVRKVYKRSKSQSREAANEFVKALQQNHRQELQSEITRKSHAKVRRSFMELYSQKKSLLQSQDLQERYKAQSSEQFKRLQQMTKQKKERRQETLAAIRADEAQLIIQLRRRKKIEQQVISLIRVQALESHLNSTQSFDRQWREKSVNSVKQSLKELRVRKAFRKDNDRCKSRLNYLIRTNEEKARIFQFEEKIKNLAFQPEKAISRADSVCQPKFIGEEEKKFKQENQTAYSTDLQRASQQSSAQGNILKKTNCF